MRKFIEIYNEEDDCTEFVNVDNIVSITIENSDDDEGYVYINLTNKVAFRTNMDYRELVRMIGD